MVDGCLTKAKEHEEQKEKAINTEMELQFPLPCDRNDLCYASAILVAISLARVLPGIQCREDIETLATVAFSNFKDNILRQGLFLEDEHHANPHKKVIRANAVMQQLYLHTMVHGSKRKWFHKGDLRTYSDCNAYGLLYKSPMLDVGAYEYKKGGSFHSSCKIW